MVQDRAIFTMSSNRKSYTVYRTAPFSIVVHHRLLRYWQHTIQWPWTIPNPVFKVTLFFDAEYLINGYRYGHSYYGRRMGNRTQAFEWYQFEWSSVTYNPDFKVTIIQRQITRKWYNIDDRAILTMADQQKAVHDLSNGAIFNDLEQPLPPVSRSLHSWRWISQKRYEIQK